MTTKITSALIISLWFLTATSLAKEQLVSQGLSVSPKQCTILNQGEVCYLDLSVSWQTDVAANYCLYANKIRLKCWHNSQQAQWRQPITMQNDLTITLQAQNQEVLHSQTIRYAWVHKKNTSKAMRWRMF